MNNRPHVSVVVLGWNNRDLLDTCLQSVIAQTYRNISIIYVDNGSTDDSVNYLHKNYPDIKIIENGKNMGFAIGNNIGIAFALESKCCEYIVLLNTDATLAKDWTQTLVSFAVERPRASSFQTATYDYYDHDILDSYGIVVDHQGRAMQMGYRSKSKAPKTQIVFGTNAAASLFSRAYLESQPFGNEYLDSDLWMYLEDVDIAARATVMGWNNWYVEGSAAYHMGSASSSKNPGFSVYQIYRNNLPMLYKNLPLRIIIMMLPGIFITDMRTVIDLIRGRNKVALKALIRGRLNGLPLMIKMTKKRKKLQKLRNISEKELWQLMSAGSSR